MVKINRVLALVTYLVASGLTFLRPFPATGSDERLWGGVALLTGPAYKLVVLVQHSSTLGDMKLAQTLYSVVLLFTWIVGLIWLVKINNKWGLNLLILFWFITGLWNLVDFGFSSVW